MSDLDMNQGQLRDMSIVCLANASWETSSRLNCHHIMTRLAAHNQVLFVESIGGRKPSFTSGRDVSKIFRRIKNFTQGYRSPLSNLYILSPLSAPGFANLLVERANAWFLAWQVNQAIRACLGNRPLVLWVFTPVFGLLVDKVPADMVIYQCVDEHSANPGAPREYILQLEKILMRRADIVITTSEALFRAKQSYNVRTLFLPNVADTTLFRNGRKRTSNIPEDINALPKPVLGFIGNLSSYKVDLELLYNLALANPQWTFVLIGDIGIGESRTNVSQLTLLPNVTMLGPRPYDSLPAYVQLFDVCLIPFAQNDVTANSFPMKFFEYLASGKPIVSTPLPAIVAYTPYFRVARSVKDFEDAIRKALDTDSTPEKANERMQVASQHSWESRMVELAKIIIGFFADKEKRY